MKPYGLPYLVIDPQSITRAKSYPSPQDVIRNIVILIVLNTKRQIDVNINAYLYQSFANPRVQLPDRRKITVHIA